MPAVVPSSTLIHKRGMPGSRQTPQEWKSHVRLRVDQYLEGTVGLDAECVVTIELDEGDEMDPEEEEARLEGEEDEE
ncbi:hypothetical protein B0H14DRAFT_3524349 [Mycena olivaceomarginata]|nr:hypothetical protein B0H14DRAFT_3524349 [Mycena olivaceomarginata]